MGRTSWLRFISTIVIAIVVAGLAQAQVNVTTWHNDVLRTGQNLHETILTPTNLTSGNFGQLCSTGLDGQVYAQPLVVSNVTFQGTQYASLVYVVTEMNTLFVINGTPPPGSNTCAIVGSLSLNPAGQYPADCHFLGAQQCSTVAPVTGILGTPVIQTAQGSIGTLFAVTETQDVPSGPPAHWYHYLHAVNLDQLTELVGPFQVVPPDFYPSIIPQISFWSRHHIQRPGLLLVGNELFVGISMMDGPAPLPDGAVFEYNVTSLNSPPVYFPTTPTFSGNGGGIWQGGSGLAYGPDKNGVSYIYFNTGNGIWDANKNWSDSLIKLNPNKSGSLTVADYFTPSDQFYRACTVPTYTDVDFGSGGPMLTPPSANWPNLAISGDKEGGVWLMDRTSPGRYQPPDHECTGQNACNPCAPQYQNNGNVQTVWLSDGTKPAIHNTPAYWNNFVYVAPVEAPILQFQLCNDEGTGQPFCNDPILATGPNGVDINTNYGATPSISASGPSSNGILWLLAGASTPEPTQAGILRAFDATTMKQIYISSGTGSSCAEDVMGPGTKYAVPTVANGYVYVGAGSETAGQGTFYIFGLNRQCNRDGKSSLHAAVRK